MDKQKVMLAAGGTGGHIFPAQALAQHLNERGKDSILITDHRSANYAKQYDEWQVKTISAGGSAGGFLKKIGAVFKILAGYFQARKLIKKIRPEVVVGFGGYPSFPTMLAAAHLGIPAIIHEQNSLVGQANYMLLKYVNKVATSFNDVAGLHDVPMEKIIYTGNPVRAQIKAVNGIAYPYLGESSSLHILVLGGSQGATVFSEVVPKAIALLPLELRQRLRVDQQCRAADLPDVKAAYDAMNMSADLATFFSDVPGRLASAHVVISRAGASTVAELAVAGRPAILVPLPSAKDDHQTANANILEEQGGAWVMPQDTFTPEILAEKLEHMLNLPTSLEEAAIKIKNAGVLDADKRLADAVMNVIMEKKT